MFCCIEFRHKNLDKETVGHVHNVVDVKSSCHGQKHLGEMLVIWTGCTRKEATAKKGSIETPQKKRRPAASTTVAATAQRVKKEMTMSRVKTKLTKKMARKVQATLINMSSTTTLKTTIVTAGPLKNENTSPSNSWRREVCIN